MIYGIENNIYYTEHIPVGREVGTLRKESEILAKELFEENKNIIISLSSGLDSQVVLHSFLSQGLKVKSAFLHMPSYNDNELENIKKLESKYNTTVDVVEIDPIKYKDDLLNEYEITKIPPNQLLHKIFLSKLDPDATFVQGLEGPNFYISTQKKPYYIESYGSFETSRNRAFSMLNRPGQIINWGFKNSILLSILQDPIVNAYTITSKYFYGNNLVYKDTNEYPFLIDHWDLYIKPHIYAINWKDELEYFPKYGGPEKIEYIMKGPKHNYKERAIFTSLDKMIDHLKNGKDKKRFYQTDLKNFNFNISGRMLHEINSRTYNS